MSSYSMSLIECEDLAKDEGFNTTTFILVGPGGEKKCRWLDAYFGLFTMEGEEGFVSVRDVKHLGLCCVNFRAAASLGASHE